MDFRIKCKIQQVISLVPFSEKLGYLFSRYITKNLNPSNQRFLHKVNEGFNHYNNFISFNKLEKNTFKYFEFGAGWTLTIPILISRLGFDVSCIDIRKLIIPSLIFDSINKFNYNNDKIGKLERPIPQLNKSETDILSILNNQLNIHYNAPQDARETGFPSEHFDFVSSTLTLCFIPQNDLIKIINECFRILKKGGVMSVTIDYQDNWSYVDSNITGYNFLQFSETEWKKYNPSIHYQNRLRHKDYLEIFENAGFTLVKEKHRSPDESDLNKLNNLIIDSSFKNYSMNELGIKDGEIVVIKN